MAKASGREYDLIRAKIIEDRNLPSLEIASKYDVSRSYVNTVLREAGIDRSGTIALSPADAEIILNTLRSVWQESGNGKDAIRLVLKRPAIDSVAKRLKTFLDSNT
jgi:hypothetical protein